VAVVALALTALAAGARPGDGAQAAGAPPGGRSDRMVETLARVAATTREENPFLSPKRLAELRRQAELLPPDAAAEQRRSFHLALGMEELTLGTARAAVDNLTTAYMLSPDPMEDAARMNKARLSYYLGLAWMRLGERTNCVTNHTGESCLFPIRGGGVHTDKEGSENAVRYFREVLHTMPGRTVEHVAAKWLLNIAYQTLGVPREQIPLSERLPSRVTTSEASFPRLPNVALGLGLGTVNLAGGAIVEDFDGDGRFDVLTSTWDPTGPMHLFLRQADGSFADRTEAAGLTGLTGGLNMVQADYDNDGDPDVLVLRGAWLGTSGKHPNSLLRNDGGGRFTDVTFEAGLADAGAWYPTQTGAWADYDNDGDLDLYVGNEHAEDNPAPGQLFRNEGDGTFTDVARAAGVENLRFAKAVVWGDYDGDRDPDLYVSNLGADNRLYRNNGDGTFTDVAPELGVTAPKDSFPVWFWDYDNDGALDLYVSSYTYTVGPQRLFISIADDLGIPDPGEPARLYRGDGRGSFEDVSEATATDRISMPMGANFGDLDNDGFLDVYLGTGYPAYDGLVPNELYWNRRGERFDEVSVDAGMGNLQKGHGIAFADLDDDGDQDVFEQMGGFYPEDTFADALYENPGFGHHWLRVKLEGRRSNRSALGARIHAEIIDGGERRSIYRWVGSGATFGGNPLEEHLGLGDATRVELLEIDWPTSGVHQSFRDVAGDRSIRIVEGSDRIEEVDRPPLPLRGGAQADRHAGHGS